MGILDMITRCADAGLPEPEFSVADGFVYRHSAIASFGLRGSSDRGRVIARVTARVVAIVDKRVILD